MAFRWMLRTAKIPHGGRGRGPRIHDLRHTFATRLIQAGVDVYKFRTMGRGIAKSRGPSQSQLDTLNVAHSTVNCTLENWYASELTDVFDQDKTNAPQEVPALAKVLANSIKRRETQLVIDAMKNAVNSLPSANVIFEDPFTPGGGSNEVGLTVDKLLRARRALKANDIMETPTLLLTEKQEADLLALTQFTSSYFTANVGAETGNIRQGHFGFNYILVGSGRDEDGLPSGVTGGGTNSTTDNRRIFAVGTTSVRSLEDAVRRSGWQPGRTHAEQPPIVPYSGPTSLYILPGTPFLAVDALITNFHLPRTTLLMLVSAFSGRELILRAYEEAVRLRYRFFSFGDALLML